METLPSAKPASTPRKFLRSPVGVVIGNASEIFASLPTKCAKCFGVRSGRSIPGELTSRLYAPGIGSSTSSTADSSRERFSQSLRSTRSSGTWLEIGRLSEREIHRDTQHRSTLFGHEPERPRGHSRLHCRPARRSRSAWFEVGCGTSSGSFGEKKGGRMATPPQCDKAGRWVPPAANEGKSHVARPAVPGVVPNQA